MEGFFPESELIVAKQQSLVPKCGACGLYKTCKSKYMKPTGKGKKKILIIAEAPGKEEDEKGIQLVGNSGEFLMKHLRKVGIEMRHDCILTNSLICRPPGNRTPSEKEIDYCRPNWNDTFKKVDPNVVIVLGNAPLQTVVRPLWSEGKLGGILKWAGFQIPSQDLNCWIIPTFHPSYLLHQEKDRGYQVLERMFDAHLEAAAEIDSKPWDTVPNYAGQVECIENHRDAALVIEWFIRQAKPCAFDYETNMAKPDSKYARIVCCSISDGDKTVAFPWHGDVIEAMRAFVDSELHKIGSNIKFEDRWTMKEFGIPVRNWGWDTMLSSHVIDNRTGITSIKFQAFVHLGLTPWDKHIKQFLTSEKDKGCKINQIHKISLPDLLRYCGIDSLVEFKVAKIHRRIIYGRK